ncbi:Receptor-type tyrosine-protein phosphatase V [Merluccius polli]|uniref:Receptor-type tyrosine-protein phosphatase V n=1 Tax=Merluccius polli TaxID=89951 RepID=A0AA47P3U5_MERPO|nr:Receptor-type tyrosine-protein phosphatase V [Merluccius polli]
MAAVHRRPISLRFSCREKLMGGTSEGSFETSFLTTMPNRLLLPLFHVPPFSVADLRYRVALHTRLGASPLPHVKPPEVCARLAIAAVRAAVVPLVTWTADGPPGTGMVQMSVTGESGGGTFSYMCSRREASERERGRDFRIRTYSKAQIRQEFQLRCQSLAANDNTGFKQEFEELHDVGKELPTREGELETNKEKNRYPYILPYDHCRVRLSLQDAQPHGDYINANFVPGGTSERDFICTQGPLRSTMADFWRMVWEQNVSIIVMVTALRQKDVVLCDEYWSLARGTVYHGAFQVNTLSCKKGPHVSITSINLQRRGYPAQRIITHYYYPSWPDRGVPRDTEALCGVAEHVRQLIEATPRLGPAVVHCSAGVGRSGVFVTLLWLMQLCERGVRPDIRAAVEDLRMHRMWMVQNLKQYICVHQCLLNWLSRGTVANLDGSPQSQGAHPDSSRSRVRARGSSAQGNRARRSHEHEPRRVTFSEPSQSIVQLLDPRNLLRRLLPSSLQLPQTSPEPKQSNQNFHNAQTKQSRN